MSSTRRQYPFHLIEPKWQAFWERQQTFRAFNPGERIPEHHPFGVRHGLAGRQASAADLPSKYYILDMFPYPSGAGLHVGHPEGYTATDILARYRRACGRHVLHPMGWDAFGLPAEQYAIKTGQHPRQTTEANIATFKRQIQSLGFSYDWSREVDTTAPGYFRWTQWIFLQLYNSYFDPEWNRATPISLLEDALSDEPKHPAQWRENPYLAGLHDAWRALTTDRRAGFREGLIEHSRLAYVSEAPVNWCAELGTVLANEEVIDGKSEVGGFPVVRRPMRQWMLRITAYAERLLGDLDSIQWSDSLKEMQRNWIGRSDGAEVRFRLAADAEAEITVFTTRPDTLFGATYMVLAPEHKLVDRITTAAERQAVADYRALVATKSDLERTELAKDKTGVFTGAFAINPVNQQPIPIWIADYVLISYGTGAIMAVPGHDLRDLEFARKFDLPIVQVVQPADPQADWHGFVGDGTAVNSAGPELSINGLATPQAKEAVIAWLETGGLSERKGQRRVNYKLRDWLFSRQRYWGEPFPVVWRNGQHVGLTDDQLPVLPPDLDDYKPTSDGQPPLARATDWVQLGDGATRETNTMPQWAGSCWYYLRYLDARNPNAFVSRDAERYWMGSTGTEPIPASGTARISHEPPQERGLLVRSNDQRLAAADCKSALQDSQFLATAPGRQAKDATDAPVPGIDLYVGGTEHAVLHLLYARFWHKVLFDLGHVSTPEPFFKLVNQGLILGQDGQKMSKSRGNVVNPDDILGEYGADAFRLYEMFMGPLEMVKPWNTQGVEGVYRFLGRVWRLFVDEHSEVEFEQQCTAEPTQAAAFLDGIRLSPAIRKVEPLPTQLKPLHAAIKKVTEDLEAMRFNTGISALMVFVNEALTWEVRPGGVLRTFLQLLAPFAPHLAEELWDKLAAVLQIPADSLGYAPWPQFDPAILVEESLEIPVQVNGKLRDRVVVPTGASHADQEQAALKAPKVQPFIAGKTVRKVIVVPGKLVNIVVAG